MSPISFQEERAACGGRLRLIATILDPGAIQAILRSMACATEAADRAPPGARRA